MQRRLLALSCIASTLLASAASAQVDPGLVAPYRAEQCPSCADWDAPQRPFRIHHNTYYVGTRGLSSLLITSADGHVLIDGGLPSSAPAILDNIRSLGFQVSDIKLIVNSHAHFDHAGGIAALQQASGARVAASRASAPVLERGRSRPDDPQYGVVLAFPAVAEVERFTHGDTLRVGPIALTAYVTAGHMPGGTSWAWRSCGAEGCLEFVYADSQTPISADNFRFTDSDAYPSAVADFQRGFAMLEQMRCDILITPHPGASSFWERLAAGNKNLIDRDACRRYAAAARQQLARRLEREAANRR